MMSAPHWGRSRDMPDTEPFPCIPLLFWGGKRILGDTPRTPAMGRCPLGTPGSPRGLAPPSFFVGARVLYEDLRNEALVPIILNQRNVV